MAREFTISLPLYIDLGIKKLKRYYINMNGYRNWFYHESNALKVAYKKAIDAQISELPKLNKISVTYHVYYPTAKRFDVMNVVSVSSKFFLDSLVNKGVLKDDNYDYVIEEHAYFGGMSKLNPRVDAVITEIE